MEKSDKSRTRRDEQRRKYSKMDKRAKDKLIMKEDRMPKKIFTQELEGTRRRGRSRKGWKEEVERDLQVLGVRRWRELVADRKYLEEYMVLNMKTGNGKVGRIEN